MRRSNWFARLVGVTLLIGCFSANASIRINVNTFADDFGSDGAHCSLREALYAISKQTAFGGCTLQAGGLLNSIGLSAGTYVMSLPPVAGNAAAGGAFYLNSSIVLQGAGAGQTFIDAQSIDSVFVVAPGPGTTTVMIDLTLQGGRSAATVGAGIYHKSGKLQLQRVVVRNTTGGYGIYSYETEGLSLSQVTVSGHKNTGVYINNYQTYSSVNSIVNTTISGNVAQTQPGGLYLYGNNRTNVTTVSNSTIAFNTGRADGQNVRSPGGVAVYGGDATLYLRNSILARNLRGSREPEDCDADSATIVSQGYNIIERDPFCPFQGATANDITGLAPQLAPLFDYGGGVPTHAVYPGTLARAAGNPAAPGSGGAACESIDARSIARTGMPCDIGAYQYHADFVVNSFTDVSDFDNNDGKCATTSGGFVCTLRAAIDQANVATTPVTIEVPQGTYAISKPPVSNYIDNVDGSFNISSHQAVTIVGAGAGKTIIDGSNLDQVMVLGNYGFDAVALHGLTLEKGSSDFLGGGLQVYDGTALLDGVRVAYNKASQGNGIWVSSNAELTINASAIDNNTWNGTTTDGGGGGIYVDTGGRLHLINSTVADNTTAEGGGGIYNFGGTVDMAYTTIAGNVQQNSSLDGGIGGSGGTYRVINSIVANNLSKLGAQPAQEADCAANVQALGYTFFRSTANCTIGQAFYAISGYDPQLSPLEDDSGNTPTAQLLPQSPLVTATSQKSQCVDANGAQVLTDQTGADRPNLNDWGNPEYCIMGAYQGTRDTIFADGFQ